MAPVIFVIYQVHSQVTQGNDRRFNGGFKGFSSENRLSVDKNGLKTFILKEADSLNLTSESRLLLGETVSKIVYSDEGVSITFYLFTKSVIKNH